MLLNALQRGCIDAGGIFEAGQARFVKLPIDLQMKLHKMLNSERPARTTDDLRLNDEQILVKPQ